MMTCSQKWLLRLSCAMVLFLSAGKISVQAQGITVTGRVIDAAKKTPLPGATIKAVDQKKGALADDEGNFTLSLNMEPVIKLRVLFIGYDTLLTELKTTPGKTEYKLDLELLGEGYETETQVITAGRFEQKLEDVTISMDVIKPAAIDVQATTQIEDVLEQSPGVDVKDGQPNIRGSSGFAYGVGSRVMIMLDGLPLLSADASFAQFDMVPLDNISQVEIMKGAASVLYGSSAMGGVINILTSDPGIKPKTSVRFRNAIYDKPANPALDWDGRSAAFQSSLNVFHSQRIKTTYITGLLDLVKESGYRQAIDHEQARIMLMTKFNPAKISGLNFGVNSSFKFDSSGAMLYWKSYYPDTAYRTVYGPNGLVTYDTVFTGGGLTSDPTALRRQLNTRLTLDPFIKYLTPKGRVLNYRGRMLRTWNTNDTKQSNRNAVYYNDFQYTTNLTDSINWVTGLTYIYNTIRGDSLYNGRHHSWNAALYTQIDIKFKRLNLTFGARYDYIRVDGDKTEASPVFRAGINYRAWKGFNVRASAGQAFRSPSIAERYTSTVGGGLVIGANPNLVVEKGYSAELAVRQGFLIGPIKAPLLFGYIDVAGFMMDYNNMIEFGLDTAMGSGLDITPVFSTKNIADTRITGIELTSLIQANPGKFNISFSGGITYINPINKNPTPDSLQLNFRYDMTGQERWEELNAWLTKEKSDNPYFLKYREKTTIRASATLGYEKVWFTSNFRLKSAMLAYDEYLDYAIPHVDEFYKTRQATGYKIFDFIFGFSFAEASTISFHIDNVFQEEYLIVPGYLAEQRKFSLQVKHVF